MHEETQAHLERAYGAKPALHTAHFSLQQGTIPLRTSAHILRTHISLTRTHACSLLTQTHRQIRSFTNATFSPQTNTRPLSRTQTHCPPRACALTGGAFFNSRTCILSLSRKQRGTSHTDAGKRSAFILLPSQTLSHSQCASIQEGPDTAARCPSAGLARASTPVKRGCRGTAVLWL